MEARDYLDYISNEIHRTVVATVDDDGLPVTAAIDMMDSDENGLYFLTAKGKGFYDRLKKREFLALTAMKGEDTMSSVAFCCISTGIFHFPNKRAAGIAVSAVDSWLSQRPGAIERVIFNVFKDEDKKYYEELI